MSTAPDLDQVRAAWTMPYPASPYDVWTRTNVGEVLPNAVTPLSWAVFREIGEAAFIRQPERMQTLPAELWREGKPPLLFRSINGRMFYNTGLLHHVATQQYGLPSWFYNLSLGGPQEGERLGLPQTGLHPLRLLRALPLLLREQRRVARVVQDFEHTAAELRREVDALRAESLDGLGVPALVARLDKVTARAAVTFGLLIEGSAAALNAYGILALLCERWLGDRTRANDLVTGLTNLLTAQATLRLWQVAQAARVQPDARAIIETAPVADVPRLLRATPAAAPVVRRLDRFLVEFGHRAVDEFELAVPRWREDPHLIVSSLRSYLNAGEEADPRRRLQGQMYTRKEAASAARRELTAGVIAGAFPVRWLFFRRALREARRYLPMRENPKHHFLRYAEELRRTALALGDRLVAAGSVVRQEDVFYLGRAELQAVAAGSLGDVRALVAARREQMKRYAEWTPPDVIRGDEVDAVEAALLGPAPAPTAVATPTPSASVDRRSGVLRGIAASTGVASGRARVALTPEEGADLQPGEILVAPFTDPGWTPLFTIAGAIVMDLGGLLSHGAIVAREYGIPAVVNTRSATRTIRSGQIVIVDGHAGEVRWSDEPEEAAAG